jgi:membrane protein
VISPRQAWELLGEAWQGFLDDHALRRAAALSYYTLFSLAPLLIISIAVAGLFFDEGEARGEIIEQIRGLIGPEAAVAIDGMLRNAARPGAGIVAAAAGLATLVFGATTAFAELKQGLDEIWRAPPSRTGGLWYTVRSRVLSFGLVVSIGFLLLVSLVFSALLAALQKFWSLGGATGWVLQVLNFVFGFAMVTAMFAMIYKMLPAVRIAWRDVLVGAGVTAALFSVGKFFIGLYLGQSAATSTYGAAGAVILILLWVNYSAVIFLFGAEFTRAWARRHGSMAGSAQDTA